VNLSKFRAEKCYENVSQIGNLYAIWVLDDIMESL
jgi:hypothetical protein